MLAALVAVLVGAGLAPAMLAGGVVSVLDWADFTWLLRNSGLSRGNLSVQMTRLSEAGYVQIDKRFVENRPRTTYSLTPEGRLALGEYKRTMSELLDAIPEANG